MKALIAYYSRAGENYVNGTLRQLAVGNTEAAAKMLEELTGADLFEIRQKTPYSDRYRTCIEEAKQDLMKNARPALAAYPANMDEYDCIYLAFPNYWGTMPMAVWTFLEHEDLSGKTIRPLCTNEGSGMGKSERDIKKLCPTAAVTPGLDIAGGEVELAKPEIEQWLAE